MGTTTRLRLPTSPFLNAVRKSGLVPPDDLVAFLGDPEFDAAVADPIKLASLFIRRKLLTKYQAIQLLNGKTRGFLLGRFKVLDGLRQDRVGLVFLAEDTKSRKWVSLKVLPNDRVSDPTVFRAFLAEVRSAAKVKHPSCARVLEMDVANGTYFVVSEHVPGPTLDKVIAEKGPLPPNTAAQYVARVALALAKAHAAGVIHRDVRPANIATTPDGGVKLIDLGLTHLLESPWKTVTRRINTKEFAEEIDHVAPELAWGNEPDARSDVYSLGSTFFTLLTGRSPFPGSAAEKMTARQLEAVPKPSLVRKGVPAEMDAIVQKMGAKDPHTRYQTAAEVAKALSAWLPVSEWAALGLNPEPTATAAHRPLPADAAEAKPARTGLFASLASLFKR
jgi:serine/threonine-protein kinase